MAVTGDASRGYVLTEEVVRWTFEIAVRASPNWWLAFANPTAGPWKRLMGRAGEKIGEVYRFPRDVERPDVVAVNDTARLLLVVEAKDQVSKLLLPDQVTKTALVVKHIVSELGKLSRNPYWGQRVGYEPIAGLLWGRPSGSAPTAGGGVIRVYRPKLGTMKIVAFVTEQLRDGSVTCHQLDEGHPALLAI